MNRYERGLWVIVGRFGAALSYATRGSGALRDRLQTDAFPPIR